jgi:hypothetical protein
MISVSTLEPCPGPGRKRQLRQIYFKLKKAPEFFKLAGGAAVNGDHRSARRPLMVLQPLQCCHMMRAWRGRWKWIGRPLQ